METTTETHQNNRELTSTEIKIAIAQIEDRLIRLAKSQAELTEFCGDGECVEYEKLMAGVPENQCNDESKRIINKKSCDLRAKYDIPDGVYLFCAGLTKTDPISKLKLYLSSWVKGKLTEEDCDEIHFYFEDIREADWGWIMLERPLGYYDAPSDEDQNAIKMEMVSIGTRSRSKNTNLPQLINFA